MVIKERIEHEHEEEVKKHAEKHKDDSLSMAEIGKKGELFDLFSIYVNTKELGNDDFLETYLKGDKSKVDTAYMDQLQTYRKEFSERYEHLQKFLTEFNKRGVNDLFIYDDNLTEISKMVGQDKINMLCTRMFPRLIMQDDAEFKRLEAKYTAYQEKMDEVDAADTKLSEKLAELKINEKQFAEVFDIDDDDIRKEGLEHAVKGGIGKWQSLWNRTEAGKNKIQEKMDMLDGKNRDDLIKLQGEVMTLKKSLASELGKVFKDSDTAREAYFSLSRGEELPKEESYGTFADTANYFENRDTYEQRVKDAIAKNKDWTSWDAPKKEKYINDQKRKNPIYGKSGHWADTAKKFFDALDKPLSSL